MRETWYFKEIIEWVNTNYNKGERERERPQKHTEASIMTSLVL